MDDANDDDGNHGDDDDDDDDEKAVPPVQTVCERGALFLRALNSQRLLLMIMMLMMMTIMQRTRMIAMISKSNQLTIRQSLLYKQESNFFLFSICIFALS